MDSDLFDAACFLRRPPQPSRVGCWPLRRRPRSVSAKCHADMTATCPLPLQESDPSVALQHLLQLQLQYHRWDADLELEDPTPPRPPLSPPFTAARCHRFQAPDSASPHTTSTATTTPDCSLCRTAGLFPLRPPLHCLSVRVPPAMGQSYHEHCPARPSPLLHMDAAPPRPAIAKPPATRPGHHNTSS